MKISNWFKKKPIKLCKDCKWYHYYKDWGEPSRCFHPKTDARNYVGEPGQNGSACVNARVGSFATCGKKGKYFELKIEPSPKPIA